MRARALAGRALPAVVALSVLTARALAGGPPSTRLIAFDRTIDGVGRVAVARLDGAATRTITTASGNELPTWSPDGRVLLYVSVRGTDPADTDLYAANVATGGSRRLTRSSGLDADPAWSPDGRSIAWTSARGGRLNIWSMRRDGTHRRQLTRGRRDAQPAWSPDGRRVAFFDTARGALEVMDANGGHLRQLAAPRASTGPEAPSWSPDGRELAIAGANGALYSVAADGSRVRRLTPGSPTTFVWRPAWSPSGAAIAFVDLARHGALEVVDTHGRLRILADRTDSLSGPSWSPDGRALAYADAAHHIVRITADGGSRTTVTRAFGNDADPAWQP